jgi:nicotinate-nucleotide pyrophosphorylase (carboxylating)
VKDNHLAYASCIEWTVQMAHEHAPGLPVEVEADTAEQALEAVSAGADFVLLDNFADDELAAVVRQCRELAAKLDRTVSLEASGGIRFERLAALRASGVDRVSTSALTFARPVDFGLDERAV